MSDHCRIYQVLEYFGLEHRDIESAHKIRCPNPDHRDDNPSAKVYPHTDTIHCFGCDQTWNVESLYAMMLGIPYGHAKTDCQRLFPQPLNIAAFVNLGSAFIRADMFLAPTEDDVRLMSDSVIRKLVAYSMPPKYDLALLKIRDEIAHQDIRQAIDLLIALDRRIVAGGA